MVLNFLKSFSVRSKGIKFVIWILLIFVVMVMIMPIPNQKPKFSRILYDNSGTILSATASSEQQWCFPIDEKIPHQLAQCIIQYEDAYIDFHPGVNPISIIKSLYKNLKSRKVKRGASTLAMQVMRLKNKHAKRSLFHKTWEGLSAVKYSLFHTDKQIIHEWCSIAPFGGNTIGIKAASLRYFGRNFDQLSWAEYALLAVMPNSPAKMHLSKNREKLKHKRDFLLTKLHKKGFIDQETLQLAKDEDIPQYLNAVPQHAYHLLTYLSKKHPNKYIFRSTVDGNIQQEVNRLLDKESLFLKNDDIKNLAAVVVDIKTNKLVTYFGNTQKGPNQISFVDIVQAPRSYGSLLKPLLYGYALENGFYLPQEMIPDIPTFIGDFQPQNFDKKFRGATTIDNMIIQSLNVPAVRVLNYVGLESFYSLLQQLEIRYLNKGSNHYGLSIILGGGETSLWDMSRVYKGLAQNYASLSKPFSDIQILENEKVKNNISYSFSPFTIDHVVTAMSDVTRPREEKSWQLFESNQKFAWKTGTSYGHKDAWAIGFNGQYMIAVWVGNEGGEGRYDLTGITKAAPIMFKILNSLPKNTWFASKPRMNKKEMIKVCDESGKLIGPLCKKRRTLWVENATLKYQSCKFHEQVLTNGKQLRIKPECQDQNTKADTFFVLPAALEYYFRTSHPNYQILPEYDPSCLKFNKVCNLVYPNANIKIFLPREANSHKNELIAKAYHRDQNAILFWYLNDNYIGSTKLSGHQIKISTLIGKNKITIVDQNGNNDHVDFEVLSTFHSEDN